MLERTDAITNEVLEPITFVLAYSNVSAGSVVLKIVEKLLVYQHLGMLERTDTITNEVLEPITFVLAYSNVSAGSVVLKIVEKLRVCSRRHYNFVVTGRLQLSCYYVV